MQALGPNRERAPAVAEWLPAAIASAARLPAEDVRPDTSLDVIGMDSLTVMAVVVQAEVIYGLELTLDDLAELLQAPRVRDLVAVIEARIANRQPCQASRAHGHAARER